MASAAKASLLLLVGAVVAAAAAAAAATAVATAVADAKIDPVVDSRTAVFAVVPAADCRQAVQDLFLFVSFFFVS